MALKWRPDGTGSRSQGPSPFVRRSNWRERDRQWGARGHLATGSPRSRRSRCLLRLLRGTGPAGLAASTPSRGFDPLPRAAEPTSRPRYSVTTLPTQDRATPTRRFLRARVPNELLLLDGDLSPRIRSNIYATSRTSRTLRRSAKVEGIPSIQEGHALGKAQRMALARALKTRNAKARVPLAGGEIARGRLLPVESCL